MEDLRRRGAARLPRVALGIAWRSGRTIVFHAALGLAVFVLAALLVRRSDPPARAAAFYLVYVLAGILVGGYVGLLTALRRETQAIVATLTGYLGTLTSRLLDDLALPSAGVEPARLRRLTEARVPVPSGGRLAQGATNFAVGRAVERRAWPSCASGCSRWPTMPSAGAARSSPATPSKRSPGRRSVARWPAA
jgi:hypothetical protein